MSDLVFAPSIAAVLAASQAPKNDVSISVPALDGLHGLEVRYERYLPTAHVGLAASAQIRETASGDYTSIASGAAAEVRWYGWNARSMTGGFVGLRLDTVFDHTRDDIDGRGIGTTLELALDARVGYRFAPWRGLEMTPTVGVGERIDIALSHGVPAWERAALSVGLSVGWMF